jgi:hypothetical protein
VVDFYNFSSIFGSENFLDQRSLLAGDDFPAKIAKAIDDCDVFVLMWCACASESTWVRRELNWAIERQKRIVPVLLSDAPLPEEIERINGVKLHAPVCRQGSMGAGYGEDLFQDRYASLGRHSKRQVLLQLQDAIERAGHS